MFTNCATRRFCSRIFRQVKSLDVSELGIFITSFLRIFRFIQHMNKIY